MSCVVRKPGGINQVSCMRLKLGFEVLLEKDWRKKRAEVWVISVGLGKPVSLPVEWVPRVVKGVSACRQLTFLKLPVSEKSGYEKKYSWIGTFHKHTCICYQFCEFREFNGKLWLWSNIEVLWHKVNRNY